VAAHAHGLEGIRNAVRAGITTIDHGSVLDDAIIAEMIERGTWDETLRILVCELKSSAAGADSAVPQLRLGKLLAEYLIRVAAHSAGRAGPPKAWCCGLIASPAFPAAMLAKGCTRPGKVEFPNSLDKLSSMRIHQMPGGGEIRLESFFD
jgi:hypothetical protein